METNYTKPNQTQQSQPTPKKKKKKKKWKRKWKRKRKQTKDLWVVDIKRLACKTLHSSAWSICKDNSSPYKPGKESTLPIALRECVSSVISWGPLEPVTWCGPSFGVIFRLLVVEESLLASPSVPVAESLSHFQGWFPNPRALEKALHYYPHLQSILIVSETPCISGSHCSWVFDAHPCWDGSLLQFQIGSLQDFGLSGF